LTSDNNIIKFKKPVHDPFKYKQMKQLKSVLLRGCAFITQETKDFSIMFHLSINFISDVSPQMPKDK